MMSTISLMNRGGKPRYATDLPSSAESRQCQSEKPQISVSEAVPYGTRIYGLISHGGFVFHKPDMT